MWLNNSSVNENDFFLSSSWETHQSLFVFHFYKSIPYVFMRHCIYKPERFHFPTKVTSSYFMQTSVSYCLDLALFRFRVLRIVGQAATFHYPSFRHPGSCLTPSHHLCLAVHKSPNPALIPPPHADLPAH